MRADQIKQGYLRQTVRELLMKHYPKLKVSKATQNAKLLIHANNILGKAAVGTEEQIMKALIDHIRGVDAAPRLFTKTREYKHDRAMLAAVERLAGLPKQISMNTSKNYLGRI